MSDSLWFDRSRWPIWTGPPSLTKRKRERHGGKRDQHQHPEGIHVTQKRRLSLHLLSDPLDGLIMSLRQRTAVGSEAARHLLQRVLISRARRDYLLDEPPLVKLLAMRQHTLETMETPIEPPVLRAALVKAEAWSVLEGGMPS